MTPRNNEPSAEEKRAQLARVIDSGVLQNAPMLQKLLEYVGNQALEGDTSDINESVLAVKVFGRPDDFDPTADTSVRTSVYRLRTKLRDYYAGPGKLDPVLIEIPKGHYAPVFRKQLDAGAATAATDHAEIEPMARGPVGRGPVSLWLGAAVLGLLLFGGGLLAGLKLAGSSGRARLDALDPFWRGFVGDDRTVMVTFSNAELLQTDTRDLLRYDVGAVDDRGAEVDPGLAAKHVAIPQFLHNHALFYEDGYSGTGEVHAVYYLTRMLANAGVNVLVKRVRLLTIDDLKAHNVILLGSSLENRAVDELHLHQGYMFDFPSGSRSSWGGRIFDKRGAGAGVPGSWSVGRDPKTGALRTDYALFSVMPGVAPNRRVMLLGGLTTSGTQGAAEFATTGSQVEALLTALSHGEAPSFFEAVLEVQVVQGLDPVSIRRVVARPIAE